MRILHVISAIDPRAGGTSAALAGMARAQAQAGMNVSVLATIGEDENLDLVRDLRTAGVNVRLVGPAHGPLRWHRDLPFVADQMVARADVVHIHALWEEVQHRVARVAERLGVPYVISPHGMLDPWSLRQKKLKKRLYMLLRLRRTLMAARALHFTTRAEHDLVASLKLPAAGIIEPLGVDLAEFETSPARGSFRSRYPQLADKTIVLFLSRLHPKKGLDLLIPAFAQVAAASPSTMLVLAGPDADGYREKVEAMVTQHKLSDRVVFTGMLYGADRVAAMADADLFVLPSYQENFGIVVVEALAAGTPVLISDQVNLHDQVTAAHVGVVVPTSVEPLAQQLIRWTSDDALRAQAATLARPFVWNTFDWVRIGQRWADHYARIVPAGGPRRAAPLVDRPESPELRARPVRVLHIASHLDPRGGGPAMALVGLARAQAEAGMHVTVAVTWRRGDSMNFATELHAHGVHVETIGPTWTKMRWSPSLTPTLRDRVASSDVVHIHALWEEIQHRAAVEARRLGVPYIIRPCGMLDPWSLAQKRFRKRIYLASRLREDLRRAALMHFTSQTEYDLSRPLLLDTPGVVEPNGLDLSEFSSLPAPGSFRARYPQLSDHPFVLFVSRLHPKKGLDLLLPAFAQAADPPAVLVIAGPDTDDYGSKVAAEAQRLGIRERVLFTGMLYGADRVAAMADADLFVLPSYQENFGIVVVEALAAGTPVVISDQVNIHDHITDARVGAVVPTEIEPLAATLRTWLTDQTLRREAGARAADFVARYYDWRAVARRWDAHYRTLRADSHHTPIAGNLQSPAPVPGPAVGSVAADIGQERHAG